MGATIVQITKRLLPDDDLKKEIETIAREHKISAGCIVSIVGSLKRAVLRVADGKTIKSWNQRFEIVSGTGTVSIAGCHIHIALADQMGEVRGGHLKAGCVINTTAEIIVLKFQGTTYTREFDAKTGYGELIVKEQKNS